MGQLKINPDTYIGDTGKQLKNAIERGLIKTLLWITPTDGDHTQMKTKAGDTCTLNDSIRNYDFIVIRIGTRKWMWSSVYATFITDTINIGTTSNVRFCIPYSCYQDTHVYTIELGFTDSKTLYIYLNGAPNNSSNNGGYIYSIYGYKFK